jgi:hypothetical protein
VSVFAWGLAWSFVEIPVQLGRVEGEVPVWNDRLLQLVAFASSRTADHPSQIVDVHYDAGYFLWTFAFPSAIGYSLLPGVVAQFRWLLLRIAA